jgi:hypothetical protein
MSDWPRIVVAGLLAGLLLVGMASCSELSAIGDDLHEIARHAHENAA